MRWVAISLEKFETSDTALRWALNRSLRQKDRIVKRIQLNQYVGVVSRTAQLFNF